MRPWMNVCRDWRRPSVAEAYSLYWCKGSGYGMIYPRPSAEAVTAYYDLPEYYTHQSGPVNTGQKAQKLCDRALLHLAWCAGRDVDLSPTYWRALLGNTPRRCCEIGCGSGETLQEWAGLGHEVVGIEPDPKAREAAESKGLTVHAGTAEDLPAAVADQRFDTVAMIHVLEHCVNPLTALQNVLKILKPGGSLVLEVPNNDCLGAWMAGITWPWLDVPRHLNFFTTRSLDLACRRAGLEPRHLEYRGYCRQYSPAWLENELNVARGLGSSGNPRWMPRKTMNKYWVQLFLTAFAPRALKYDSVRIIAQKPC